jgi:hypothetical protein
VAANIAYGLPRGTERARDLGRPVTLRLPEDKLFLCD